MESNHVESTITLPKTNIAIEQIHKSMVGRLFFPWHQILFGALRETLPKVKIYRAPHKERRVNSKHPFVKGVVVNFSGGGAEKISWVCLGKAHRDWLA